jgi:GT2 family glycosyltransferase
MGPSVSIITPAFQAHDFLADAVRSVLAQTFGDFELLVVDDGSTDQTADIAQSFATIDARIRLIRQSNGGTSSARNTALAHARAPLFALLDSDDVWMPDYLEEQVRLVRSWPSAGIVSANAINLGGMLDGTPLRPIQGEVQRLTLQDLIEFEESVTIMAVIRREVYERIGGFDTSLRSSEDYDYWIRSAAAGFDVLFNPKPLAFYRRRTDSISADGERMFESITRVLRKATASVSEALPEGIAIARQLACLESRALAESAKCALHRGEYADARTMFAQLARQSGLLQWKVAAAGAHFAPRLLRLAHDASLALRRRRARRRAQHEWLALGGRPIVDARSANWKW